MAFGKAGRELPLAASSGQPRVEAPAGIAKRPAGRIVKANADAADQKALPTVDAGLEATRGRGMYALQTKKRSAGVER